MLRRFPRPDLKVRTFFLTEQEILEASSGAEISLVLPTFFVTSLVINRLLGLLPLLKNQQLLLSAEY